MNSPYTPSSSDPETCVPWYRNLSIWVCIGVIYVGSYLVVSRRAFAATEDWGLTGIWFALPDDGDDWRRTHYTLTKLYFPLIVIDSAIGTGRPITPEPMWSLTP